jgi:hypothetical protein
VNLTCSRGAPQTHRKSVQKSNQSPQKRGLLQVLCFSTLGNPFEICRNARDLHCVDTQAAMHAAATFSGIHADCFLSFLLRNFRNYHRRPHAAHSIVIIAASIIIVILIQLVTLVQRSLASLLLTLFRLATYSLLYAEAYFVHLQGGP